MSAQSSLPPDSFVAEFTDAYHRRVSPADLAKHDPAVLRLAVQSHLRLGSRRAPGERLVRVFTATPEADGWTGRHTIIQVVMDDMPYLVDSISAALSRLTRGIVQVIHPILYVERDPAGELRRVTDQPEPGLVAESWSEFLIQRLLTTAGHDELAAAVAAVLEDVSKVNRDQAAIAELALDLADQLAAAGPAEAETAEFLRWLADGHFAFLGHRAYQPDAAAGLTPVAADPLGIYIEQAGTARLFGESGEAGETGALLVTKTSARSTVLRAAHMDYLGVRLPAADGGLAAEHRFLGLLNATAAHDSVFDIPVMRKTAEAVLRLSGMPVGSHSYNNLVEFIEDFPRDLLLQVRPEWLAEVAAAVLDQLDQRTPQSFVHFDRWRRFANVLVFIPRDVFGTKVRLGIERLLGTEFEAAEVESSSQLSDRPMARLHFALRLPAADFPVHEVWQQVQRGIRALARSWQDDFAELVVANSESDEAADDFLRTWLSAFDEGYRLTHSVDEAWADSAMASGPGLQVWVLAGTGGHDNIVKLVRPAAPILLSDLLPVLTAFGMTVAEEHPYVLRPAGLGEYSLQELTFSTAEPLSHETVELLESALVQVLGGAAEVDELLSLVLQADLSHRQVEVLRAYANYVAQWGLFSLAAVREALVANPAIAARLAELFEARLRPGAGVDAKSVADEVSAAIDAVRSLEQDRALRAVAAAVLATSRTNAYQRDEAGNQRPALALKFAGRELDLLPAPRPFAEIWVESPRVRGVHLRFGAVARGGLRWSDRREDLRTEVLGLVRAQVVKNAVIVPTGAKGGFLPKQLPDPAEREAWLAAGVAAYREFIGALLDVTDNLQDGAVVPPVDTVRLDGDDPYLVVAADKGTATFSDYANEISLARGFWLGDAFASGGSVGYDHKAMGITARGAWESVRHHFARLGLDPERDPITAVGIGDMSGDVFGNGMLLSSSLRLVAAFDHRDIFIDPAPDAAKSQAERQRLFNLPRSSWADYDPALISQGGGVYSRGAKRIELSPAAWQVLGLPGEPAPLSPAEVVSAILRAPVDLLWNGGIGTYVKAGSQSHTEVGDKANDQVRVNGAELRCRVVGEGGNLGFTQQGRVEAALAGVRINTDAIDNSAGVDTSDHEVNLKILLGLRRDPAFGYAERNELLASLTDDVAALVLADNIAQNQVLTLAEAQAGPMGSLYLRLIDDWHQRGLMDRRLEDLPGAEVLAARIAAGGGLVRPEFSVLLAHAKLSLTEQLLDSPIVSEEWTEPYLFAYFPGRLQRDFADEIRRHPLRREIVATVLANRIVNAAGISALWRTVEETGAAPADVARAFALTLEVGGVFDVVERIASLGNGAWPARTTLLLEVRRYIDRVARWFLANRAQSESLWREAERWRNAVAGIRPNVGVLLKGAELERWQSQAARYKQIGVDAALADTVAALLDEYAVFDLVELAGNASLADWSTVYFEVSAELAGDALLSHISALPRTDRWQTMARAALRADMYSVLAAVTGQVMRSAAEPRAAVDGWRRTQAAAIGRVQALVAEIGERPAADIAAISVALRNLRALVNQTAAGD